MQSIPIPMKCHGARRQEPRAAAQASWPCMPPGQVGTVRHASGQRAAVPGQPAVQGQDLRVGPAGQRGLAGQPLDALRRGRDAEGAGLSGKSVPNWEGGWGHAAAGGTRQPPVAAWSWPRYLAKAAHARCRGMNTATAGVNSNNWHNGRSCQVVPETGQRATPAAPRRASRARA